MAISVRMENTDGYCLDVEYDIDHDKVLFQVSVNGRNTTAFSMPPEHLRKLAELFA